MPDDQFAVLADAWEKLGWAEPPSSNSRNAFFHGAMIALQYIRDGTPQHRVDYAKLAQLESELAAYGF
jgi:hypothetical protein